MVPMEKEIPRTVPRGPTTESILTALDHINGRLNHVAINGKKK